jgi:2-polyprenyl-3-methyl-5-hydroxy-6-metoxy-1,4-benzoquinol methylase
MPNYGDPIYWENRYQNQQGSTFDWLEDYETLKSIISDLGFNKEECQILMLGCGNAEMSEDMYTDGYKNIVNIDISEHVINQMSERCKSKPMKCKSNIMYRGGYGC